MNKLIAGVTSLALAGCSVVFVHGPDSSAPRNVYPECTSGKTWPIIDTVVAGVFAAAAITAIKGEDDPMSPTTGIDTKDSKLSPRATAAVSITTAALAGAGAFVGFRRVGKCRASRETFAAAYPQGAPTLAPMPGQYPAPPPEAYGAPPPGFSQGHPALQGNPPPQQGTPLPQPVPPQPVAPQAYPPPQPAGQPQRQPLPPGWAPTPMPSGYEGGACLANNACAQGLVCASGLCVRPPATTR